MDTKNTSAPNANRDEFVWRMAQHRAKFQKHLLVYGLVNALLWGIWAFTVVQEPSASRHVWPLAVMFWWGIGLGIQGLTAYGIWKFDEKAIAEKEYQKMMNR